MTQHHFKYIAFTFFLLCTTLFSCSDKNGDDGGKTQRLTLQQVVENDIDGIIRAQYKVLATNTSTFYEALSALETSTMTQEQLEKVCQLFLKARGDYEKSEAFFFGANAHFTVDADINSWPLDRVRFQQLMQSSDPLDDSERWASGIVGWHGIEYVIFRDGKPRPVADITARELKYAKTLSANLRLRCYQLYCGWNASAGTEFTAILDAANLSYHAPKGADYRDYFLAVYTPQRAAQVILTGDKGMMGLSDEMARTKFGDPFEHQDADYIESPYSHTSLEDLRDNLQSIRSLWFGNDNNAFDAWFNVRNPAISKAVREAFDKTLQAINAVPEPFVKHYNDPTIKQAIAALDNLSKQLEQANDFIQQHND